MTAPRMSAVPGHGGAGLTVALVAETFLPAVNGVVVAKTRS